MYLSVSLLIFFFLISHHQCAIPFLLPEVHALHFPLEKWCWYYTFSVFHYLKMTLFCPHPWKLFFPPQDIKFYSTVIFSQFIEDIIHCLLAFFYCYWEISCHFHVSFFWRQSAFISFFFGVPKVVLRFVRCEFLFNHPGLKFIQLLPFQIINLSSFFLTELWLPACSYLINFLHVS